MCMMPLLSFLLFFILPVITLLISLLSLDDDGNRICHVTVQESCSSVYKGERANIRSYQRKQRQRQGSSEGLYLNVIISKFDRAISV